MQSNRGHSRDDASTCLQCLTGHGELFSVVFQALHFFSLNWNSTWKAIMRYGNVNIQRAVTDQLKAITPNDFQHCCKEWEQRLRRCIATERNYFEGDHVVL